METFLMHVTNQIKHNSLRKKAKNLIDQDYKNTKKNRNIKQ